MFMPSTAASEQSTLGLPFAFTASLTPSTSSTFSSGTSTSRTSPSLLDFPTPPDAPISTPSPLASSSLLPLLESPRLHPLDAFETSLSGLPTWSASIDPTLLFGLEAAPSDASSKGAQADPERSFFPPGSPIVAEREQQRNVPLFGESTTPEQRQAQIVALSSLILNGAAASSASSAGPAKRTRSAADGRSRSLSHGRPNGLAVPPSGRGRRASVNVEASGSGSSRTSPTSSSKSWLDALREAEAKAKLKRMQQHPSAGSSAPRGRLALMHGQLLAQSLQAEMHGMFAPAAVPPVTGAASVFPWGRS